MDRFYRREKGKQGIFGWDWTCSARPRQQRVEVEAWEAGKKNGNRWEGKGAGGLAGGSFGCVLCFFFLFSFYLNLFSQVILLHLPLKPKQYFFYFGINRAHGGVVVIAETIDHVLVAKQ